MTNLKKPAGNRRLAKKRVQWLIEHSTSYQVLCWVDSLVASNSASSPSAKTLPASLKDVIARMNDRNTHKVTGQMNHPTANPKANASVFLFFSTAHFLKTILASRTNGTFAFAPTHKANPSAKAKEPFFAN
jgi:hypothetical protein